MDNKTDKTNGREGVFKLYEKNDETLPPTEVSTLKPSGIEITPDEKWSCYELVRRYKDEQIDTQPDFQRNFVWTRDVQTLLIDSLANEIPIPHLFLGLDTQTGKYNVIDGLQRVRTIINFFDDPKFKLSNLPDVDSRIAGKSVLKIKKESEELYNKLENRMIHYTLIKCDFTDSGHMDYLFRFFNRINTGGKVLKSQEIRNCICKGEFNNVLKKVAKSKEWKVAIGPTPKIDRLNNEEVVLKTFAFVDKLEEYDGELSRFLDRYMSEKRDISGEELEYKHDMMVDSLLLIHEKIDNPKAIRKFGRTVKEMLLVGIAHNIDELKSKPKATIQTMFASFQKFVDDDKFKKSNLGQGSSKKEKVKYRLSKAISIFAGVKA